MALYVKKYGGSSVATPEKLKAIAEQVAKLYHQGHQMILVVSAMGQTTNELSDLAYQVAQTPNRRELDMLLSTGERISMALMSMALNDIGVPAISFTGSQAGVFTDMSHNNAKVIEVKPVRVEQDLAHRRVIVIAGFQGVHPGSKEITTLGRGGSDTTAVALAAYFKAAACETLKDVDGIYSADPKIVKDIHHIPKLSYDALLEMTFWGASVLHYRAVELAKQLGVPLFVGLAHGAGVGTQLNRQLEKEFEMYEQEKVLSVNSHLLVKSVKIQSSSVSAAIELLEQSLVKHSLPWPQVLHAELLSSSDQVEVFITGPAEHLKALELVLQSEPKVKVSSEGISTVTATCQGLVGSSLLSKIHQSLQQQKLPCSRMICSSMSVTFFVSQQNRERVIQALHTFC